MLDRKYLSNGLALDNCNQKRRLWSKTHSSLFALEPRIMLDAAMVATAVEAIEENTNTDQQITNKDDSHNNHNGSSTQETSKESEVSDPASLFGDVLIDNNDAKELIIIDARVLDYQTLIEHIDPTVEIYFLNSQEDGIQQISDILSQYSSIDSLHIVSHGDSAELLLGNTTLNENNLNAYEKLIGSWADAFTTNGDLYFYGCNVAEGEKGQDFLKQLSNLTQADIGASDDLTGHAEQGGDWDLEYTSGVIEDSQVLKQFSASEYDYLLDINVTTDPVVVNEDTFTNLGLSVDLEPDETFDSFTISNIPFGADVRVNGSSVFHFGTVTIFNESDVSTVEIKAAPNSDSNFTVSTELSTGEGGGFGAFSFGAEGDDSRDLDIKVVAVADTPAFFLSDTSLNILEDNTGTFEVQPGIVGGEGFFFFTDDAFDGSETVDIIISGVPTGWNLSISGTTLTREADGSYIIPTSQLGPIEVSNVAHSDTDATFSIIARSTESNTSETGVDEGEGDFAFSPAQTLSVTFEADADTPVIIVNGGNSDYEIPEDDTFELTIVPGVMGASGNTFSADTDGSESYSLEIYSDDFNVIINGALTTLDASSPIVIPVAAIPLIQFTQKITHSDLDGSITFRGVSTETNTNGPEGSNDVAYGDFIKIDIEIDAVADVPSFSISDVFTKEDQAFGLSVTPGVPGSPATVLRDTDGSEVLYYRIERIPTGVRVFDNGVEVTPVNGVYRFIATKLADITLLPAANSDVEFTLDLVAEVIEQNTEILDPEHGLGSTAELKRTFQVTVEADADTPTLVIDNVNIEIDEDAIFGVSINPITSDDTDGSEIYNIIIKSTDFGILLDGVQQAGTTVTVSSTDLGSIKFLQLVKHSDLDGQITFQSVSTEHFTNGMEGFGDKAFSEEVVVFVEVDALADTPLFSINPINTLEDTAFSLNVIPGVIGSPPTILKDTDGSEVLYYNIKDLPAGVRIFDNNVEVFPTAGVYRFIASKLPDITLLPPAHSDAEFTFTLEAEAVEENTEVLDPEHGQGSTARFARTVSVIVEADADKPSITVNGGSDQYVAEEDKPFTFSIEPAVPGQPNNTFSADTDGSEEYSIAFTSTSFSVIKNGVIQVTNNDTVIVSVSELDQISFINKVEHSDIDGTIIVQAISDEINTTGMEGFGDRALGDPFTLNVTLVAVADEPGFFLEDFTVRVLEDQRFNLPELIPGVTVFSDHTILRDLDGSEVLLYSIENIPSNVNVYIDDIQIIHFGSITIPASLYESVELEPFTQSDDNFEFLIVAIAVEANTDKPGSENGQFDTAEYGEQLYVQVVAVPDLAQFELSTDRVDIKEDETGEFSILSTFMSEGGKFFSGGEGMMQGQCGEGMMSYGGEGMIIIPPSEQDDFTEDYFDGSEVVDFIISNVPEDWILSINGSILTREADGTYIVPASATKDPITIQAAPHSDVDADFSIVGRTREVNTAEMGEEEGEGSFVLTEPRILKVVYEAVADSPAIIVNGGNDELVVNEDQEFMVSIDPGIFNNDMKPLFTPDNDGSEEVFIKITPGDNFNVTLNGTVLGLSTDGSTLISVDNLSKTKFVNNPEHGDKNGFILFQPLAIETNTNGPEGLNDSALGEERKLNVKVVAVPDDSRAAALPNPITITEDETFSLKLEPVFQSGEFLQDLDGSERLGIQLILSNGLFVSLDGVDITPDIDKSETTFREALEVTPEEYERLVFSHVEHADKNQIIRFKTFSEEFNTSEPGADEGQFTRNFSFEQFIIVNIIADPDPTAAMANPNPIFVDEDNQFSIDVATVFESQEFLTDLDGSETLGFMLKLSSGLAVSLDGVDVTPGPGNEIEVSLEELRRLVFTLTLNSDVNQEIEIKSFSEETHTSELGVGEGQFKRNISEAETIPIIVKAIADVGSAKAPSSITGDINTEVDLPISPGFANSEFRFDTDGSETPFIVLSDIPANVGLKAGGVLLMREIDGSYVVSEAQLADLKLVLPDEPAIFDVKAVVRTIEQATEPEGGIVDGVEGDKNTIDSPPIFVTILANDPDDELFKTNAFHFEMDEFNKITVTFDTLNLDVTERFITTLKLASEINLIPDFKVVQLSSTLFIAVPDNPDNRNLVLFDFSSENLSMTIYGLSDERYINFYNMFNEVLENRENQGEEDVELEIQFNNENNTQANTSYPQILSGDNMDQTKKSETKSLFQNDLLNEANRFEMERMSIISHINDANI